MLQKDKLDFISILQENDALIDGHFTLPNGKHIQIYIDTDIVLQYPNLATKAAKSLSKLFPQKVDVVFSPSPENTILAVEVAKIKKARAVCATLQGGLMALKQSLKMKPGENVLIVDNVMMTGRKIYQAQQLLERCQAHCVGAAVLIDRSNGITLTNIPLRALATYPLEIFDPEDCPLCKINAPLTKKGGK